ncbi:MAG: chorismate synthase [Clostridiales bacterium]|jgi:chorismate synthase|nr:chorismate synthase [Clostridiales bacterium]
MSGSRFGKNFTMTTWGESHGPGVGAVVDGCPAGVALSLRDLQKDMERRRPGASPFSTQRKEKDEVRILSGVFHGKTTGTPISLLIENLDQRSEDYDELSQIYRPGHADYTYDQKYGIRDYRGGGRASGRETAARVAAGAVAKAFLRELRVQVQAYTVAIGNTRVDRARVDLAEAAENPFYMPDKLAYEQAKAEAENAIQEGDSLGGVVECLVSGLKSGVGEPVIEKLQAVLGMAIFSIGAVKGLEFGAGFSAAEKKGSENNDAMLVENGRLIKQSNHAGGSYGGISDGSALIFRAAFKPTPSIAKTQQTINSQRENVRISVKGRHDPLIVPRAVVVVEAMAAAALADLILQSLSSRLDVIQKIYGEGILCSS